MMQIYVDGDACPTVCKEILYRVAEKRQLQLTLVANTLLRVPGSRFIRALQVPAGADAADAEIVRLVEPGDLVVTADNIAQQLTMRAFMEELRSGGVETGGPAPYGNADRQNFANQLDRHLAKVCRPAAPAPASGSGPA